MFGLLKKAWLPIVLVVVVGLGAYAILRIRETDKKGPNLAEGSGITENFNPKHIKYEITGSGGTANINYLDEYGQPNLIENAPLPWSFTIVTTLPSMSANIMAQGDDDVSGLGCRVTVDDDVRDDRTSTDTFKPFIYCLVKSV